MPERRCRMCVRASSRPTPFPPSVVLLQRPIFQQLMSRDFRSRRECLVWFWAPARTPKDIIAKLNAATVETLANPSVRATAGRFGAGVFPREQQTPAALVDLRRPRSRRVADHQGCQYQAGITAPTFHKFRSANAAPPCRGAQSIGVPFLEKWSGSLAVQPRWRRPT